MINHEFINKLRLTHELKDVSHGKNMIQILISMQINDADKLKSKDNHDYKTLLTQEIIQEAIRVMKMILSLLHKQSGWHYLKKDEASYAIESMSKIII